MMETTKYKHSTSVPHLYKEASKLLQRYENKEGSLKNLVFNNKKYRNYKKMYGLLCKTIQNSKQLQIVLEESKLLEENPSFNIRLAKVITADLLFRNAIVIGTCKPLKTILSYKKKLISSYKNVKPCETTQPQEDNLPRYVVLNTIVSSAERTHAQLNKDGWKLQEYDTEDTTYDQFLTLIKDVGKKDYLRDYHLDNLLVFPTGSEFWKSKLYKSGAILLQNKASCLPVFLSGVGEGNNVIDACAAPGNKTTNIAVQMNNNGKIFAVERKPERFVILKKLLQDRGVKCVNPIKDNFTNLDIEKFADAEYIFVDPTCSSSGMNIHTDEVSASRLSSLANFQLHILEYALSFPKVKVVVYSTCSINSQENEEVVTKALAKYSSTFELEDIGVKLKEWTTFGEEGYDCSKNCLRTKPNDLCHGFFVAKFIRVNDETVDCNDKLKSRNRKNFNLFKSFSSFKGDNYKRKDLPKFNGTNSKKRKTDMDDSFNNINQLIESKTTIGEGPLIAGGKKTNKSNHMKEIITLEEVGNKELESIEIAPKKKKNKNKQDNIEVSPVLQQDNIEVSPLLQTIKVNKHNKVEEEVDLDCSLPIEISELKIKKKKSKRTEEDTSKLNGLIVDETPELKVEKKRKHKTDNIELNCTLPVEIQELEVKKKKKCNNEQIELNCSLPVEISKKKKLHKKEKDNLNCTLPVKMLESKVKKKDRCNNEQTELNCSLPVKISEKKKKQKKDKSNLNCTLPAEMPELEIKKKKKSKKDQLDLNCSLPVEISDLNKNKIKKPKKDENKLNCTLPVEITEYQSPKKNKRKSIK